MAPRSTASGPATVSPWRGFAPGRAAAVTVHLIDALALLLTVAPWPPFTGADETLGYVLAFHVDCRANVDLRYLFIEKR